jgi:hypothetical protein
MPVDYVIIGGELKPTVVRSSGRDELGRFVKNIRPWNKGKKGLNIGGKETQFKKGNLPHNTLYDGCVRIRHHKRDNRDYQWIRISKGNWKMYSRYVWEQHNGKIPAAHIIVHKDGNTLNCDITNLEMISMAENIKRNRNLKKANASLRERWKKERIREKYGLPLQTKLLRKTYKKRSHA